MTNALDAAVLIGFGLLFPALTQAEGNALLGNGGGLDHVGLLTLQLDQAADDFQHELGFQVSKGGRFADGIRNDIIRLANYQYLELATAPDNATDDEGREVYTFAKKHEGSPFFGMQTSSAEESAAFLRRQGFDSVEIQEGKQVNEKDLTDSSPHWKTVSSPEKPRGTERVMPASLFLIEYLKPHSLDEKWHAMSTHPNGATGIKAVLLATMRIGEQTDTLKSMGLTFESASELPLFGLKATVFGAGRGKIYLLDGNSGADPVKSFFKTFDDDGILGVIFEVPDLAKAITALTVPYLSESESHRIWVKPEFAHGLWIGFEQSGEQPAENH
jgi:hypothetical protein